jgi:hypothetical protein
MVYRRWLGDDATGARLAVVALRATPEGYAGTLAAVDASVFEGASRSWPTTHCERRINAR